MAAADPLRRTGGEMGGRIADHDWAATPLGPWESWSPALRGLVQQMLPSGFPMFLWAGPDLLNIYNDAYRPLLGGKHPALGRPAAEVWADVWDVVGPLAAEVMEHGSTTWSEDLPLLMERDGFQEETYFTFSYSPFRDDEGEDEGDERSAVGGVFCAVTETTERVVGERRLLTLRAVGDALAEARSEDDVLEAAAAALAEHAADLPFRAFYGAATTRDAADLRWSSDPQAAPRIEPVPPGADPTDGGRVRRPVPLPVDRVLPDPGPIGTVLACPLVEPDAGAPAVWLVVGLNPRRPVDADYLSFVGVLAGLVAVGLANARAYEHERRRAALLAELDTSKTTFFANVSHEFRTPLTLLLAPIRDALDDEGEALGPRQRERLEIAHRNGLRMLRLVESLLEAAQVDGGLARAQFVPTALAPFTAELASVFRSAFEQAGVDLDVAVDDVGTVHVDRRLWETVVLNLISNALKYTTEGRVRVEVRAGEDGDGDGDDDHVVVRVVDTGIGIPPDEQDRVFERFHRVRATGGRSVEGAGIGLALVHDLVHLHGGTIEVESTVGEGSAFTVRLPRGTAHLPAGAIGPAPVTRTGDEPDDSAATRSPLSTAFADEATGWIGRPPGPAPEPSTGVGRARILVVDDNADMNRYLVRLLAERWEVMAATDGDAALAAVRSWHPHLVVSDVMMPGTGGIELTRAIRDDPAVPDTTAVVLLSARAGSDASFEGLDAGADAYVTKPFTAHDLVRRIELLLDRAQSQHRSRLAEQLAGALASAPTLAAVAQLTAEHVGPALGTVIVGVGAHHEDEDTLELVLRGQVLSETQARFGTVPLSADLPVCAAVRTRRAVLLDDRPAHVAAFPGMVADLDANGYVATASLPFRDGPRRGTRDTEGTDGEGRSDGNGDRDRDRRGSAGDRSKHGVLLLGWPEPVDLAVDPDLVAELRDLADVVAAAVERVRATQAEHAIAQGLQREFLALAPCTAPVAVAATYRTASDSLFIGGDWYDVVQLDGSEVAVAVGDVVGSGLPAAATMSQLRSAAGAAALVDPAPTGVVTALDRFARRTEQARYTTAFYGRIDLAAETFSYLAAGHPPPVLVDPHGEVHLLDEGRSWPLGVFDRARTTATGHAALPAGSLLVLYTDGLIERREETLDVGLDRLRATLATLWHRPTPEICARLVDEVGDGGGDDDTVVLAVRTAGSGQCHFTDVIPGVPGELPGTRRRLRDWLRERGAGPDAEERTLLAVSEAVTNAVEHGGRSNARLPVTVEAALDDGHLLTVSIRDHGGWASTPFRAPSPGRGHGFALMRKLADDVHVEGTPDGSTVTLRLALS